MFVTAATVRRPRHGISLLEVLISMFVLLFGLMGVAALFPVGNHYAASGQKYDRAAAGAPAAFAELRTRGYLRPEKWLYGGNPGSVVQTMGGGVNYPPAAPIVIQDATNTNSRGATNPGGFNAVSAAGPGRIFVIDPMGVAAALSVSATDGDLFPYGYFDESNPDGGASNGGSNNAGVPQQWRAVWQSLGVTPETRWPIRRVTVKGLDPTNSYPFIPLAAGTAETICRFRDDLSMTVPTEADEPGRQLWKVDDNGTPDDVTDDVPLARQFGGSYSWFATIAPTGTDGVAALQPAHPQYGQLPCEVSVAVCYKRVELPSPQSERAIAAELLLGNELTVYANNSVDGMDAVNAALDEVRSGQWIALAGVHPTSGQLLLKWYRILSMEEAINDPAEGVVTVYEGTTGSGTQRVGRRLMLEGPDWPMAAGVQHAPFLRAVIVPGVVGVTTQSIPMQGDSPWSVE